MEAETENAGRHTGAARALLHSVLCEVALAAVIILIVALLGVTAPPHH
jgi:putative copper export protein